MNNIDILEEIKNKFNKTMKILALGEHSTFVDNSFFDDFGKLINISETIIAENKELKETVEKRNNKIYELLDRSINALKLTNKEEVKQDYIPKSKVEEKIEELEKDENLINAEYFIKMLQSLLGKE